MREYKFRGFATAPEKWVYGNLMEKYDPTKKENVIWCRFIQDKALSMEQVAIESVGQFTGLKDKNGKEIYEGDVIECLDSEGKPIRHSVIYDESRARFAVVFKDWTPGSFDQAWINEFGKQVIGNIYENGHLLK